MLLSQPAVPARGPLRPSVTVALYQAALFSSLLHHPHLLWIDNYNKGFQKALALLDTGTYLRIDATCFVLVLLKQDAQPAVGEGSSTSLAQNTLPSEFSLGHLELFITSFDGYNPPSTLRDSLAAALQVWNNPLHPPGACTPWAFAASCLEGR